MLGFLRSLFRAESFLALLSGVGGVFVAIFSPASPLQSTALPTPDRDREELDLLLRGFQVSRMLRLVADLGRRVGTIAGSRPSWSQAAQPQGPSKARSQDPQIGRPKLSRVMTSSRCRRQVRAVGRRVPLADPVGCLWATGDIAIVGARLLVGRGRDDRITDIRRLGGVGDKERCALRPLPSSPNASVRNATTIPTRLKTRLPDTSRRLIPITSSARASIKGGIVRPSHLSRRMVDYKFELCGGLYGQVLRSLTTQDAVDVNKPAGRHRAYRGHTKSDRLQLRKSGR